MKNVLIKTLPVFFSQRSRQNSLIPPGDSSSKNETPLTRYVFICMFINQCPLHVVAIGRTSRRQTLTHIAQHTAPSAKSSGDRVQGWGVHRMHSAAWGGTLSLRDNHHDQEKYCGRGGHPRKGQRPKWTRVTTSVPASCVPALVAGDASASGGMNIYISTILRSVDAAHLSIALPAGPSPAISIGPSAISLGRGSRRRTTSCLQLGVASLPPGVKPPDA